MWPMPWYVVSARGGTRRPVVFIYLWERWRSLWMMCIISYTFLFTAACWTTTRQWIGTVRLISWPGCWACQMLMLGLRLGMNLLVIAVIPHWSGFMRSTWQRPDGLRSHRRGRSGRREPGGGCGVWGVSFFISSVVRCSLTKRTDTSTWYILIAWQGKHQGWLLLGFFMYFWYMMMMMYYYDMFRTFSYFYDIYVCMFYIISCVLILTCSC